MSAIHGVMPMLVTPFDRDGSVALDQIAAIAERQLEAGVAGLSALGLGGEAAFLDPNERGEVARRAVAAAAGAPVVVGCGAPDRDLARQLAIDAAEAGAAAVMLAPPAGSELSREGLVAFFAEVAAAVEPLPLMVQDAPAFLDVELDPSFVIKLARLRSNVVCAKPESVPAADAVAELSAVPGLSVFGGHGGLYFLEVLEAGADGLIPGCEHPAGFQRVLEAWESGDVELARHRFSDLLPLLVCQFQSLDCFISSVKLLLHVQGLTGPPSLRGRRWPLGATTERILLSRARAAGAIEQEAV